MKVLRLMLFSLLLFLLHQHALALPGDVVATIPTPGKTPTGLTFDGKSLWVADRLADSLYALNPVDGTIQKAIPSPSFATAGLAWDGNSLWIVDEEEGRIYELDVESGITLRSIESPTPGPQGITFYNGSLFISDPRSDILAQISCEDGTTIEEYPAPMNHATGLTHWKNYLWSADRTTDMIYLMAPDHDGEVVLALDAPGPHVRGLATDGKFLYAVDYQDDTISKIVIDDGERLRQYDSHTLDLQFTYEFRNYGPGEVLSTDAWIAIAQDGPTQRLIEGPLFTPEPMDYPEDRWGQQVAHFRMTDLPLAQRNLVSMNLTVELNAIRQYVFPDQIGREVDIPKEIRTLYLSDEEKYRIHDPRIVQAVEEAIGEETNPYWKMRNIHRYIREHLYYELSGGWNVAPRVLERGNGSCSEFTFLFISMCRAAGIPARYVGSVVVRGDEASTDDVFHRWSQVYLPGYGWLHVDPQGGDKKKPSEVGESIGRLDNRFLLTTFGGGASEYLGWSYNYDTKWQSRGPVKVHTEMVGEWSPAKIEATPEEDD